MAADRPLVIVPAPSALGLAPQGVAGLPRALLDAGLGERLGATVAPAVVAPPHEPQRDPATQMLNPRSVAAYAVDLADAIGRVLDAGAFPVVLGGDCSIFLGSALALRRRGRFGVLYLDGHGDVYQPSAEPHGEAASMDLALALGHGPNAVVDLEGRAPLLDAADVCVLGHRDQEEATANGSRSLDDVGVPHLDLGAVRTLGIEVGMARALAVVTSPALDGFWLHLDVDVLDDRLMPAVDYRLPGGLSWSELDFCLRAACGSRHLVGIEVTILNPTLDPDGRCVRALVDALGALAQ